MKNKVKQVIKLTDSFELVDYEVSIKRIHFCFVAFLSLVNCCLSDTWILTPRPARRLVRHSRVSGAGKSFREGELFI
jgi:hypothetical protein